MKGWVYDCETNTKNVGDTAVGSFAAAPFHPDNHIVCWGEATAITGQYQDHYGNVNVPMWLARATEVEVLLIGHNIGFDLMYSLKEWPEFMERALPNLHIWDTQQVEYLLSGQRDKFPSLDQTAARLGLPLKDDRIKQYWADGVDTAQIPKNELLDYQKHDVMTTRDVFKAQWQDVRPHAALYTLVKWKMDDILMSTMMQWYGMKFDLEVAAQKLEVLDKEIEDLYNELTTMAEPHFINGFEFNPSSGDHISILLYGGDYAQVEDVVKLDPDGEPQVYKSGAKKAQIKTRKEKVVRHTDGFGVKPPKRTPKSAKGIYSTDHEFLSKVKHPFAQKLLRYRELKKDADTYYRGYSSLVWGDGCIHPSLNNEATDTGRQSCSKPNLQNVSKEEY